MSRRLGRNVKRLRRRRGMSQQDLAEAVGYGGPMLSGIEAGRVLPSVRQALRIARVLGATPNELFDGVR